MPEKLLSQKGFTLIEILIAMALMAMILTIIPNPFQSSTRGALEEVSGDLRRSLQIGLDESILRGSIVRLRIDMEATPAKYVVEYGPKTGLILPDFSVYNEERGLSIRDKEALDKRLEDLNSQFQPVTEFSEEESEVNDLVTIIGVATNIRNKFINDSNAAIYFYPTGEKDSSIIILGTDEEIVTIVAEPFMAGVSVDYHPIQSSDQDELDDIHQSKAKEIYENWTAGHPLQ